MRLVHIIDNPKATLERNLSNPFLVLIIPQKQKSSLRKRTLKKCIEQAMALFVCVPCTWKKMMKSLLPHCRIKFLAAKIFEQIAQQMQNKKLPLVSDLRDESDHENPTRLVIIPRSNRVDVEALMDHLFATTDLERSYRVNLNMIGLNGRPQVKGLLKF